MGKAIPRRIGRHVHPAARPEAAPEPAASGIDYLALVAERVAAEVAERIGYASLAVPGAGDGAIAAEVSGRDAERRRRLGPGRAVRGARAR